MISKFIRLIRPYIFVYYCMANRTLYECRFLDSEKWIYKTLITVCKVDSYSLKKRNKQKQKQNKIPTNKSRSFSSPFCLLDHWLWLIQPALLSFTEEHMFSFLSKKLSIPHKKHLDASIFFPLYTGGILPK